MTQPPASFANRSGIEAGQLGKLRALLTALVPSNRFYSAKLRAAGLAPRTAREFDALGRSRLRSGDLAGAAQALDRALELQPEGFWPNFHRGVCAYRQGHFEEGGHTGLSKAVGVPQSDRAVVAGAGEQPTIRAQGDAVNRAGVPFEDRQALPAFGAP